MKKLTYLIKGMSAMVLVIGISTSVLADSSTATDAIQNLGVSPYDSTWEVKPSLDTSYQFLTGLDFTAHLQDSGLHLTSEGPGAKLWRTMIPARPRSRDISYSLTPDTVHLCYPYTDQVTLNYYMLRECFDSLKQNSAVGPSSNLAGYPFYSAPDSVTVWIFGYYISACEYDNNITGFHNWPWGDGNDECKYHPGCYICEYSDGTVSCTLNFDIVNPKYYYLFGTCGNDNSEETAIWYNGVRWLHQVNSGSKADEQYDSTSFPSELILNLKKTRSRANVHIWGAIVADSVAITGRLHGEGSTTVDATIYPDVLVKYILRGSEENQIEPTYSSTPHDVIICDTEYPNRTLYYDLTSYSGIDTLTLTYGYFNFDWIVDEYPAGITRETASHKVTIEGTTIDSAIAIIDTMTKGKEVDISTYATPGDTLKIVFSYAGGGDATGIVRPFLQVVGTTFGIKEDNTKRSSVTPIYKMSQNYPNPMHRVSSIRYEIPRTSQITLSVYNITGQKVRTLVKGKKKAGDYTAIWDGRDDNGKQVASSTYFYRLEVDGKTMTKKAIVLR